MSDFGSPTSTSFNVPLKRLHVVAAIIRYEGMILAARRLRGGPSSLKWEFPGGKVEEGETPEIALLREIREELAISIEIKAEMGRFPTVTGKYDIDLHCFYCTAKSATIELHAHSEIKWCALDELGGLDWALPDIPVVNKLITEANQLVRIESD